MGFNFVWSGFVQSRSVYLSFVCIGLAPINLVRGLGCSWHALASFGSDWFGLAEFALVRVLIRLDFSG